MADYLVDTNHLSMLVAAKHLLRNRIIRQIQFGDSFSVAVPALTEMLFGLYTTPRAKQNLLEWMNLRIIFNYYEIDQEIAERAASLQFDLLRHGWQLSTVDALIATIALRYNLILLTTDQDFRSVPGLVVENWLAK